MSFSRHLRFQQDIAVHYSQRPADAFSGLFRRQPFLKEPGHIEASQMAE